ncbi:hypothetical protein ANCCEY_00878 [Ancylostoma ceylanicum]|uniref:Uncharacterized protein n=1 Tax=Ancylostoma ceylanicum TaxID=53326 RepID=A0A0D6M7F5_9BILA|nr:hypothetical protein ANCCEY_00878 [Ancylostoma ceylanicum]
MDNHPDAPVEEIPHKPNTEHSLTSADAHKKQTIKFAGDETKSDNETKQITLKPSVLESTRQLFQFVGELPRESVKS